MTLYIFINNKMQKELNEFQKIYENLVDIKKQREKQMIELDMEVFRYIDGFDNYLISNLYNVFDLENKKLLKPIYNFNTFEYEIELIKDNVKYYFNIDELVADAFLVKPNDEFYNQLSDKDKQLILIHIDKNSRNNNLKNLKWITTLQNKKGDLMYQYLIDSYNRKNDTSSIKIILSGYTPIIFDKNLNKWKSKIRYEHKLGAFDSFEDASRAFNNVCRNNSLLKINI